MDSEFQRGQMTAQLDMLLAKVVKLEEGVDAIKTLPTRIAALEAAVARLETPVAQFSTVRAQALALWAAIATVATVAASAGQPLLTWLRPK